MIDQGANLVEIGSALAQALWSGLWIGVLVAAFVFFYVRTNRGLNAASRHVAWYVAMVVIASLPAVSFAFSLSRAHLVTPVPVLIVDVSHPAVVTAPFLSTDALERIGVIAGLLVAAIALARIVVLFVGLVGLWKVKRASRRVDPSLSPTLARTMARDVDARPVSLRLSDSIDAPAAAGFRSPAILLPADLVDSLEAASLDQIAMHEYAHLRRYDDWTNLFQRFVERVFWFNPAIWFVGGRIDLEREIACDDWAVAGADGVSGYADCLWHLARNGRVPSFAATAPGAFVTQSQIAARIEHLLERRRDSAPTLRTSRLIAIAPVLVGALVLVAGRAPGISLTAPAPSPIVASVEIPAVRGLSEGMGAVEIHLDRRGLTNASTLVALPATHCPNADRSIEKTTTILARSPYESSKFKAATDAQTAWIALPASTVTVVHTVHTIVYRKTISRQVRTQVSSAVGGASRGVGAQVTRDAQAAVSAQAGAAQAVHAAQSDAVQAGHDSMSTKHTGGGGITVHAEAPKHFTFVVAAADATDNLSFGPNDRDLIAHCSGCDLSNKDLQNADLHGLTLTGDDLSGADLRGANLRQTTLTGVDLSNARLDRADLSGAVLTGTDISGATFDGAKTDGIRLVGMQLTDEILSSTSARSLVNACAGCDLSNLDLHGRDLHGITLDGADLSGADLSGANLQGAHFNGVDFSNVKLHGADLRYAIFNGCDLSGVDLSQARTDGIEIRGSKLSYNYSSSDNG